MDDIAERIEEIKRLWFNTTPVKTPHYKYAETRRESAIWLITELEKARERVKLAEEYVSIQASSICHSIAYEKMMEQQKKIESLQSQLTSAREALEVFGIHQPHCPVINPDKTTKGFPHSNMCICGYDEALANLKEAESA